MSTDTSRRPAITRASEPGLLSDAPHGWRSWAESHQLVGEVRGLQKEAVEPRGDEIGVEVTTESFGGAGRRLQACPPRIPEDPIRTAAAWTGSSRGQYLPSTPSSKSSAMGPIFPATMGRPAAMASMIARDDDSEYDAWTQAR